MNNTNKNTNKFTFNDIINAAQTNPVYKLGNYLALVDSYKPGKSIVRHTDEADNEYETLDITLNLKLGERAGKTLYAKFTVNIACDNTGLNIYNALLEALNAETADKLTFTDLLDALKTQPIWVSIQQGQKLYWRPDYKAENLSSRIFPNKK